MKIRLLFLLASTILLGAFAFEGSFAVPPMERLTILSDTKILDVDGNEIDSVFAQNQIIIATPSFTTAFPLSVHYGCGKTVVDGDEIRCTGFLPELQHVEGDQLIGELRFEQHAVSITQISDEDNTVVHLSWIEGILATDHVISPTVSWIPEKPGTYSITTFFWESIGNPTALGPPASIEITVN
ncbi:MAG: hypothetical protein K5798_09950 [Nitrosopumilus sp.]|uniref:hypothetical protein n=1 Tax=Nitrosopumilus sp. TaxID=2024843 RepID=UPI00242DF4A4|nr:hypothetical protein [Nitrosopumilus sp.]MCV0367566.1 hypothetical protein [Nitrosopumilus sp.]